MSQDREEIRLETIEGRIKRLYEMEKPKDEVWSTRHIKRNLPLLVAKYCYYILIIICVLLHIAAVVSPAWLVSDNCWTGLFYKCCVNNQTVCHLEEISTPIFCLEFLSAISGLSSAVVIFVCLLRGIEKRTQILKHAHFLYIGSGSVNVAACLLFIPYLGRPAPGFIVCFTCSLLLVIQVCGLFVSKKPNTGG